MTDDSFPRPEARYGRAGLTRKSRRRVILGLTAAVLTAGIAIAVIGYLRIGTAPVTGTLAGYQVIDDETASVTITVTRRDPSRTMQATVQVTTTVKSGKPPMVADVYGCGTDVPAYLRPS